MYRRIVHPQGRTYYHIGKELQDLWAELIPTPKDSFRTPKYVWAFTELGWEIIGEETFRRNKFFSVIEFNEYLTSPYDEVQVALSVSWLNGDKRKYNEELREVFSETTTFIFEGIKFPFKEIFSGDIYCAGRRFLIANFDRMIVRGNIIEAFEDDIDSDFDFAECKIEVSGDISTTVFC